MKKEDLAIQLLVENIVKYVRKASINLPFNVTKTGQIVEIIGNNQYKVKIEGAVYTVPSAINDTFKVNDTVLILYPNNSKEDKCVIGTKR